MIEINRTEVKIRGELPTVMSEMQFGLIALYDALKQHYSAGGDSDGEIKDAIEYKEALDAALDKIKKS